MPTNYTAVCGELVACSFRGGHYQIRLKPEIGPLLTFDLDAVDPLGAQPGDWITLAINPNGVVLLPAQEEPSSQSCREIGA